MSCLHGNAGRAAVGIVAVLSGCTSKPSREWYLPERTVPPDITALPADFETTGGPVLIRLTEWPNSGVLAQLEAAGLQPLPGYSEVERLDSLGMSYSGGTVTPGGLERILALQYVIRVQPAPAAAPRSGDAKPQYRRKKRSPGHRFRGP
jgi:hypothetical protein